MGRAFLVKVRLDVLRANLSAADKAEYTRAQARRWLLDAGFVPAGAWWRVNESNLCLESSEVAQAVPEVERVPAAERAPRARVA